VERAESLASSGVARNSAVPGRDAGEDAQRALFDPALLQQLERLELLARKVFRGLLRGEHTSLRRGRGQEFADYRRYQPGDDFRYIDWNIFQRLDRLFLKLYTAEEDLGLYLLIDSSASMGAGDPTKFDHARRLAASLAYIGLNNLDRVVVAAFGDGLTQRIGPLKTRQQITSVLDFLSRLATAASARFDTACKGLTTLTLRPGLVVVLSDLFTGEHLHQGLRSLRGQGHDVLVIQLLAEEEIEPPLDGALSLVDIETGGELKVTVDAELRAHYRRRLARWLEDLERSCVRLGCEYMRVSTAIPFEDVVLNYLRRGGHFR